MGTIRRTLMTLLSERAYTSRDLSQLLGIREKDVYGHLEHVRKSVTADGKKLTVLPAQCLDCDYVFRDRYRLTKPGRCPRCRGEHLAAPRYHLN